MITNQALLKFAAIGFVGIDRQANNENVDDINPHVIDGTANQRDVSIGRGKAGIERAAIADVLGKSGIFANLIAHAVHKNVCGVAALEEIASKV